MYTFLFVIFVDCYIFFVYSAKILAVFPTPSISHQIVYQPFVQELVKRGHVITVITPDPAFPKGHAPANLTEIDLHDISYTIWSDLLLKHKTSNRTDVLSQVEAIMKTGTKVVEAQIAVRDVQDIINKKKGEFDLLLIEPYPKSALIFSYIYEVPVITISSLMGQPYEFDVAGAPTHPLMYPIQFSRKVNNLTIWEKVYNLYSYWQINNILEECEKYDNKVLQKILGRSVPTVRQLFNNIHMAFLYSHPVWLNNKPLPPSVIYIGRINRKLPKELPEDLQNYLDSSVNGVIYFSLGTNVIPSLLPPNKVQMMIKVFSELPYNVIWKWDKDTLPGRTNNIKIYKWLPQADLLRHPNVKLFITQGGLQSTDEAIHAEVPLVGIPMLGDQWYNTEKYEQFKIGIKLEMYSLIEKEFRVAIETVTSDKRLWKLDII